jgi:hypothetical protein
MPEQKDARRLVGIILMFSAVLLGVVAALFFTGVLPVDPEIRPIVSAAMGVAALADLAIGAWFFSMGQSS